MSIPSIPRVINRHQGTVRNRLTAQLTMARNRSTVQVIIIIIITMAQNRRARLHSSMAPLRPAHQLRTALLKRLLQPRAQVLVRLGNPRLTLEVLLRRLRAPWR